MQPVRTRPGALTQHKIDRTRSAWDKLIEVPLCSTNSYTQEGDCIILTSEAGTDFAVYDRSAGVAHEKFAGCAISDYRRITDFVKCETTVVPTVAAFTYQLAKTTPVAGTFFLQDAAGTPMSDVSPGVPAAVNQYAVSASGLVTFHAAKAGVTIALIRYTYIPTVREMNALFYQRPLIAQGQSLLQQVAIAVGHVQIFTTAYATHDTFTVGAKAYTGVGGKFTVDTTAAQIAGVVISLPTVSDVFLGVAYDTIVPGVLTW